MIAAVRSKNNRPCTRTAARQARDATVGRRPAPDYRNGSRAASRVKSGDVPPKQPRLGLSAALQLSDRHMSRLPTRGHRPYLQRRHLQPLRLPPHAAFVVVQRPRRSLESTAVLPSPARFQSTAKDRYWDVTDPRVPNAKTAATKNGRLTLIVFIPTSSDDQPTIAIRDPRH